MLPPRLNPATFDLMGSHTDEAMGSLIKEQLEEFVILEKTFQVATSQLLHVLSMFPVSLIFSV